MMTFGQLSSFFLRACNNRPYEAAPLFSAAGSLTPILFCLFFYSTLDAWWNDLFK